MIPFARVPTELWLHPSVRKAGIDYALLIAFYHSHPAWGLEGFSRCSDHYVIDYVGLSKSRVTKLRRQMMDDGLIVYDEATEEMYLPGFLVANPLRGSTNAVSLQKNLDRLKSQAVREAVLRDVGADNLAALLEKHEDEQAKKRAAAQLRNGRAAGEWGNSGGQVGQLASDALRRGLERSR